MKGARARCRVQGAVLCTCRCRCNPSSSDQEPHQRQPELARVWNRLVIDQHVGRVEAADDVEEIAERGGGWRKKTDAVAQRRPGAEIAVLRPRLREIERARVVRPVEWRELD